MKNKNKDKIKELLDEKYESYMLIGQKKEFDETDLYLHAYTMGIISLLQGAFGKYPPLKEIIKNMINE